MWGLSSNCCCHRWTFFFNPVFSPWFSNRKVAKKIEFSNENLHRKKKKKEKIWLEILQRWEKTFLEFSKEISCKIFIALIEKKVISDDSSFMNDEWMNEWLIISNMVTNHIKNRKWKQNEKYKQQQIYIITLKIYMSKYDDYDPNTEAWKQKWITI